MRDDRHPEQYAGLDLNSSPALPEAAVDVGMTPDSLSADTRAALKTGFIRITESEQPDDSCCYTRPGGFLGRPCGYER